MTPAEPPQAEKEKRAIIVDDSPVIRLMLRRMLEEMGYRIVAEADNHDAAFEAYQAHRPHLLTLDLALANVEGQTILDSILRFDPEAKVLVVTGREQAKIREKLLKRGAAGYLVKPFSIAELKAAVASIFQK